MNNSSIINKIKSFSLIKNQPDSDWKCVVYLILILCAASMVWSAIFFLGVKRDMDKAGQSTGDPVVNSFADKEKDISDITEKYDQKILENQLIKDGGVGVLGDPSLF